MSKTISELLANQPVTAMTKFIDSFGLGNYTTDQLQITGNWCGLYDDFVIAVTDFGCDDEDPLEGLTVTMGKHGPISAINPISGHTTTWKYNAAGLVSHKNAKFGYNGERESDDWYEYNEMGKETLYQNSDSDLIFSHYDDLGLLCSSYQYNKLLSIEYKEWYLNLESGIVTWYEDSEGNTFDRSAPRPDGVLAQVSKNGEVILSIKLK